MLSYIWPIALVVVSNIVYQVCAKSAPEGVSPFASLTVTYLVGAAFSTVMFFVTARQRDLLSDFGRLNWSSVVLGIVIVGLEVGFIYAYKAGWQVSTASIVQSSFLAIGLLVVGALAYHEALTWNKLVGVLICMVGLIFINMK